MGKQVTLTAIRKIVQEETSKVKEELKVEIKKVDNKIVEFKDQILGEIEKSREEMIVTKGYGNQLEDHGESISTLEKTSHTHP